MAFDPWSLIPGLGSGDATATLAPTTLTTPTTTAPGPIYQTLPNTMAAFQKRYGVLEDGSMDPHAEFAKVLAQFSPQTTSALKSFDTDRVTKGQMPLNTQDAAKALLAAETKQAITPTPEPSPFNIPGNAVTDLKTIVKSLPHLPGAMVGEVKDLFDGTNDNYKEMDKAGIDNPIARFLNLPGIRLLPGAFVGANVAEGDFAELAQHPLITALDVLPYASKLAKGTKVVQAADTAREAAIASGKYAPKVRPIPTVLTKTLDDAGNIVPTKLGDLMETASSSRLVTPLRDAFGKIGRETTRDASLAENYANTRHHAPAPDDKLGQIANKVSDISTDDAALMERYGLTRARETELSEIRGRGDLDEFAALPANEQKFLVDMRQGVDDLAEYLLDQPDAQIGKYGDEIYPIAQVRRLNRADKALHDATIDFMGGQRILKNGNTREVAGVYHDLTRLAAADDRWAAIQQLVDAGDIDGAAKAVNRMKKVSVAGPKAEGYSRYFEDLLPDSLVTKTSSVTDQSAMRVMARLRTLAQTKRTHTALIARSMPARFDDVVREMSAKQMILKLADEGVITDIPGAYRWVREGVIDQVPGFDKADWSANARGIARNWQALKDAGIDPTFQQRVAIQRVNDIGNIRFDGSVPSLQQAKSRIADWSPSVKSPSISLSHQAMDIIRNETGAQLADDIGVKWGRPEAEIRQELLPQAEAMAARDPRIDIAAALDELVRRKWRRYTPETLFPFAGRVGGVATDSIWIPRDVASVLEQANKEGFTKLRTYSNPITRVWRVSLLPLSPRWHLYNIVGGAMMTMSEAGPGAFKNWKIALDTARAARDGKPLPVHLPDEIGRVLGEVGHPEAELAFKRGMVARQLADNGLWNKGKSVVKKSYEINSLWDDMYRTMSYLQAEQTALAKYTKRGIDLPQAKILAQREGVETARKVLQDAASMTPFERSVMRQVIPFYGWLSHLVRFVTSYPADHPWRTAILANASQVVMEDLGSGANLDQLDAMYFGGPNESGERSSINIGSLNPFTDVGNLFSLAGWMGSTNPLFQTAAQALGIDTSTGMGDLYPNKRYDPETGRMIQDTGNPLRNLMFNTLPQAQIASAFLGIDPEFAKLQHNDPEAAERRLWSAAGLPMGVVPKAKNPATAYIKNERARSEAEDDALSKALKSGNLNALDAWPNLRPLKPLLLEALKSGQLDEYIQPPKEN